MRGIFLQECIFRCQLPCNKDVVWRRGCICQERLVCTIHKFLQRCGNHHSKQHVARDRSISSWRVFQPGYMGPYYIPDWFHLHDRVTCQLWEFPLYTCLTGQCTFLVVAAHGNRREDEGYGHSRSTWLEYSRTKGLALITSRNTKRTIHKFGGLGMFNSWEKRVTTVIIWKKL